MRAARESGTHFFMTFPESAVHPDDDCILELAHLKDNTSRR